MIMIGSIYDHVVLIQYLHHGTPEIRGPAFHRSTQRNQSHVDEQWISESCH